MNVVICDSIPSLERNRMSLDREQVRRIAHLARLHITGQEADAYAETLSRILGLIEQMNAVDTAGVEPMAHPNDGGLRLREDAVAETNQREKFQNIAPAVEAGLYLVPKVIE
jgi:aspartyl-tRNA(Asn)/glutamyl-tRNA(Gln) amidotransferase subunit C